MMSRSVVQKGENEKKREGEKKEERAGRKRKGGRGKSSNRTGSVWGQVRRKRSQWKYGSRLKERKMRVVEGNPEAMEEGEIRWQIECDRKEGRDERLKKDERMIMESVSDAQDRVGWLLSIRGLRGE